jgi:phosphoribosylformylglycinamidine cyclo-ligase
MDYQSSGVNIEAGTAAVELIKDQVQKTFTPQVLSGLGQFSAFYELPKGYTEPVMVSCTDGVGTKLKLAIELGVLDTVGIDLVAMCVNDLICSGAKPLFFLDYIACHKLVPEQMNQLIKGMTAGCIESGCSLVGGEMAEMKAMYKPGDFDLAGFSVGVVEKKQIIDGSKIAPDQYVYGFPSSGAHSNGFSLINNILDNTPDVSMDIKKTLLTPTKLYVAPIQTLLSRTDSITGIAHITGGGLQENIERILPDGVGIDLTKQAIRPIPIFEWIQKKGDVAEAEMLKVFNMGVGLVVISSDRLPGSDDYYEIGRVTKSQTKEVLFV